MDEPAFTGCLVRGRLLGVIEAEETSDGKTQRNNGLIAVAAESHTHSLLKSLEAFITEIEHFFVSYNQMRGKKFEPLVCEGPDAAMRLAKKNETSADVAHNRDKSAR